MLHKIFELQGDEGDIERVKMNLILAAAEHGNLEITETKKERRFKGFIIVS